MSCLFVYILIQVKTDMFKDKEEKKVMKYIHQNVKAGYSDVQTFTYTQETQAAP